MLSLFTAGPADGDGAAKDLENIVFASLKKRRKRKTQKHTVSEVSREQTDKRNNKEPRSSSHIQIRRIHADFALHYLKNVASVLAKYGRPSR